MSFIFIPPYGRWFVGFGKLNSYCVVEVPNIFICYFYKSNDHSYDYRCFFYHKKMIFSDFCIRSKRELISRVQSLIDRYLPADGV